jgi:hypothetical protein
MRLRLIARCCCCCGCLSRPFRAAQLRQQRRDSRQRAPQLFG